MNPCCERTLAAERGSCLFGCNAHVDPDTGFCPVCKDHSANRVECETCGQAWEDWGQGWEPAA